MLTVVFAFSHDLSGSSQRNFIFVFFEKLVVVDDTLDERLFEVCKDFC